MTNSFDIISVFAVLISVQALWQLSQNWTKFWDDRVTWKDRELAQRLAIFVLIPIGILLHEIGHSLATWQVGGTVLTFQWRFYWGYIIPSGNFSPAEYWWIALSGNLVSILLGLAVIPCIPYIRKRIVGEIVYNFACAQSMYALVGYPLLSLGSQTGDWVKIYDFSVRPYAAIALIVHIGLLWGLWHVYHSQTAVRWRLAVNPNAVPTWESLKADLDREPDNLKLNLELSYFLLSQNEVYEAQQAAKKVYRIAPHDEQVCFLRVSMDYTKKAYRKAIQSGRQLLNANLSAEDRLRLYRILSFSLYKTRQLEEALSYADLGITLAPENYQLRWQRASVYQALGKHQEAKADLDIALANTPDDDSRQQIQQWMRQYSNRIDSEK